MTESENNYITIGSRKDDAARIQGPPSSTTSMADLGVEGEIWTYGTGDGGVISFNQGGRVEGWMNQGDLKVRMVPGPNATTSEFFSIGSHKDDVAQLHGTPYSVMVPNRRTRAEIQRRRQEEREHREIMREIGAKDYEPIYSPEDDSDLETWRFPGGIIEFAVSTGRVTAWDDQDGSLKTQGVSPETEAAKKSKRAAFAPASNPTPNSHTTPGGGCLLTVLSLFVVVAMAAFPLATLL